MTRQLTLSNKPCPWYEFANTLQAFRDGLNGEVAYAYIVTKPGLRHETERLCRDLSIEDYVHILEDGERPPEGAARGVSNA